jgi:predicted esterase
MPTQLLKKRRFFSRNILSLIVVAFVAAAAKTTPVQADSQVLHRFRKTPRSTFVAAAPRQSIFHIQRRLTNKSLFGVSFLQFHRRQYATSVTQPPPSRLFSTSSSNSTIPSDDTVVDKFMTRSSSQLRMLALHGSGGTGLSIMETMQQWNSNMERDGTEKGNNNPIENKDVVIDITTVNGHVPMENGFSWWKLAPGERSSTADCYNGFEISEAIVLDTLKAQQLDTAQRRFDVIMGHSQGAILLTALLALNAIPYHPQIGYILNGVAWPNPYSLELESVKLVPPSSLSTISTPIRILVIVGERDTINPPEQAHRVVTALERAGCDVTVLTHPNGHSIPSLYGTSTWKSIRHWLLVS